MIFRNFFKNYITYLLLYNKLLQNLGDKKSKHFYLTIPLGQESRYRLAGCLRRLQSFYSQSITGGCSHLKAQLASDLLLSLVTWLSVGCRLSLVVGWRLQFFIIWISLISTAHNMAADFP